MATCRRESRCLPPRGGRDAVGSPRRPASPGACRQGVVRKQALLVLAQKPAGHSGGGPAHLDVVRQVALRPVHVAHRRQQRARAPPVHPALPVQQLLPCGIGSAGRDAACATQRGWGRRRRRKRQRQRQASSRSPQEESAARHGSHVRGGEQDASRHSRGKDRAQEGGERRVGGAVGRGSQGPGGDLRRERRWRERPAGAASLQARRSQAAAPRPRSPQQAAQAREHAQVQGHVGVEHGAVERAPRPRHCLLLHGRGGMDGRRSGAARPCLPVRLLHCLASLINTRSTPSAARPSPAKAPPSPAQPSPAPPSAAQRASAGSRRSWPSRKSRVGSSTNASSAVSSEANKLSRPAHGWLPPAAASSGASGPRPCGARGWQAGDSVTPCIRSPLSSSLSPAAAPA